MSLVMIQSVFLFQPALSPAAALAAIKAAIDGFGVYEGETLVPAYDGEGQMLEQGDVARFEEGGFGFAAQHKAMGRLTNEELWTLEFRCVNDVDSDFTEIHIDPYLSQIDEEQVRRVWDFMVYALPRFALAMKPSLAMCNGLDEDEGQTPDLPTGDQLRPGELPPFFTPWLYLGPDRLNSELRARLAKLPAYRSEAHGEGWLVQAVPDLYTKPPRSFIEGLKALSSRKPIGYKQTDAP